MKTNRVYYVSALLYGGTDPYLSGKGKDGRAVDSLTLRQNNDLC